MLEMKYKDEFKEIFKSITMDNGTEFLDQEGLETSCLKEGQLVIMHILIVLGKEEAMRMLIN